MKANARELLLAAFSNIALPVFVVDDKGKYVEANKEGCKALGSSRSALLGSQSVDAPNQEEMQKMLSRGNFDGDKTIANRQGKNLLITFSFSANALQGLHVITWTSVFTASTGEGMSRNNKLSARERQVVSMLAAGQGKASISRELGISPSTVASYNRMAMLKLGAKTETQAAVIAALTGQIEYSPKRRL